MALENNFSFAIPDEQQQKREITKLTELKEEDKNTIFNLIFADANKEEIKE